MLKGDLCNLIFMHKKNGLITNYRERPYNPSLKDRAKEMRNSSTKGEIKFWCELLRKRQTGYQFYRQKILYHYIVDFYCPKLKLVIEIDGTSHEEEKEYDEQWDKMLTASGLKVLHYNDVKALSNFHLIGKDFYEQIKTREVELDVKLNSPEL